MEPREFVPLSRECEVVRIPSGEKERLPAGMQVQIMQSLGGTYTVMTNNGYLVRIAGKDADVIGKDVTVAPEAEATVSASEDVEALVWEQLKTVYDRRKECLLRLLTIVIPILTYYAVSMQALK